MRRHKNGDTDPDHGRRKSGGSREVASQAEAIPKKEAEQMEQHFQEATQQFGPEIRNQLHEGYVRKWAILRVCASKTNALTPDVGQVRKQSDHLRQEVLLEQQAARTCCQPLQEAQARQASEQGANWCGDPDAVSNLRQELLDSELELATQASRGQDAYERAQQVELNLQRSESSLEVVLQEREYYCEEANRKRRLVQELQAVNQEETIYMTVWQRNLHMITHPLTVPEICPSDSEQAPNSRTINSI